jgi:Carboxylesterase family
VPRAKYGQNDRQCQISEDINRDQLRPTLGEIIDSTRLGHIYNMHPSIAGAIALALTGKTHANPTVTLSAGTVNGGVCSGNENAVYFKGIPYAQPPVDSLRFEPPQAYTQKYPGGAFDGTKAPPACIQFGSLFRETGPTSEDW